MKIKISAFSDMGCVRKNNEDMISINGVMLRDNSIDLETHLSEEETFSTLLADGMGGHDYGEVASEYTLSQITNYLSEERFSIENIEDDLRIFVQNISVSLNKKAQEEHQTAPMGCTLTGLLWLRDKVLLVNAGDSRTYRFRNGFLKQLSIDDTERELSGNTVDSKLLVNCIGGGCDGRLFVKDITENIHVGDKFLLCSDGLTDMVDDDRIEEVLANYDNPAEQLVNEAKENGGYDNISVVTLMIKE